MTFTVTIASVRLLHLSPRSETCAAIDSQAGGSS